MEFANAQRAERRYRRISLWIHPRYWVAADGSPARETAEVKLTGNQIAGCVLSR